MNPAVAIIGGGVSGTLIVLNCLKQASKPLDILWFDGKDAFCKGLAYSTVEETHLLNVRASNMSVFTDEPGHFVNWLVHKKLPYSAKDFVPRKLFGTYILETYTALKEINPHVKIIQKPEEVKAVNLIDGKYVLTTERNYTADKVVLALGNFLPAHPRSASNEFKTSPNYFQDAFNPKAAEKILANNNTLTLIGAGLTMVDVVVGLKHKNYKGNIYVISPHGYLPQAHNDSLPAIENFMDPAITYSLSDIVRIVRSKLKETRKKNMNPQSVIDALRPHLQGLWLGFSIEEKKRFLRHLRHKWGVARHRVPQASMEIITGLMHDKKLTVLRGRIFTIDTKTNGFDIRYTDSSGEKRSLHTTIIVNCTGPEPDITKTDSALVKQLIHSSLILSHELAYGLHAARDGAISNSLFTIGPPLKGVLWESTAVPEIRVQAREIAAKIIFD